MKIALLQRKGKVEEGRFCAALQNALDDLKGDLTVDTKIQPFSKYGWTVLDVTGDDTEIFIELVSREFGLAPSNHSGIEIYGNYRGTVRSFNSDLIVDIGIEEPEPAYVRVKLSSLRAQLADGRGWVPAREISELYCLVPGTPISIRVTKLAHNETEYEGWLSDSQTSQFSDWLNCGLERVQVYDCLKSRLHFAISRAKLERDIVSTEQLNLTTHSVLCKIGTDAIGVIPSLGFTIRQSELKAFIPKRIQEKCRGTLNGA
ncbi:MAG: DUF2110 family protein [Candidatus Bathyarchaeia archaeon]|jgi:hypothetical protein